MLWPCNNDIIPKKKSQLSGHSPLTGVVRVRQMNEASSKTSYRLASQNIISARWTNRTNKQTGPTSSITFQEQRFLASEDYDISTVICFFIHFYYWVRIFAKHYFETKRRVSWKVTLSPLSLFFSFFKYLITNLYRPPISGFVSHYFPENYLFLGQF